MAIKISELSIIPIVGDGGIGNPDWGDGRLIPVLVLDCTNHPELYELILIHTETPPGDVMVKWGRKLLDKRHAYLSLDFSSPVKTSATIQFNLPKQGGLVDGIIRARGVYLQPLQSGRRVSEGLGNPKLLIEVPSGATFSAWPQMYQAALKRDYRKQGASRSTAAELTREHLARVTDLWTPRVRRKLEEHAECVKNGMPPKDAATPAPPASMPSGGQGDGGSGGASK